MYKKTVLSAFYRVFLVFIVAFFFAVTIYPGVFALDDFSATSNNQFIEICSGESFIDNLYIFNSNSIPAYFTVDSIGATEKWSTPVLSVFVLDAYQSQPVQNIINPPAGITGNYTIVTEITANDYIKKQLKQTISIISCQNMQVNIKQLSFSNCPCSPTEYKFDIKNTGGFTDTFESVVNLPANEYSISSNAITLKPGESGTVYVYITKPCSVYGDFSLEFSVKSRALGLTSKTPFFLNLRQDCYDFDIIPGKSIRENRINGSASFEFEIEFQNSTNYQLCSEYNYIIPIILKNKGELKNTFYFMSGNESIAKPSYDSIYLKKNSSDFNYLSLSYLGSGSYPFYLIINTERGDLSKNYSFKAEISDCFPRANVTTPAINATAPQNATNATGNQSAITAFLHKYSTKTWLLILLVILILLILLILLIRFLMGRREEKDEDAILTEKVEEADVEEDPFKYREEKLKAEYEQKQAKLDKLAEKEKLSLIKAQEKAEKIAQKERLRRIRAEEKAEAIRARERERIEKAKYKKLHPEDETGSRFPWRMIIIIAAIILLLFLVLFLVWYYKPFSGIFGRGNETNATGENLTSLIIGANASNATPGALVSTNETLANEIPVNETIAKQEKSKSLFNFTSLILWLKQKDILANDVYMNRENVSVYQKPGYGKLLFPMIISEPSNISVNEFNETSANATQSDGFFTQLKKSLQFWKPKNETAINETMQENITSLPKENETVSIAPDTQNEPVPAVISLDAEYNSTQIFSAEGQSGIVIINSEVHEVIAKEISDGMIVLEIRSEPQLITINAGGSSQIDLDGDGEPDMIVKYEQTPDGNIIVYYEKIMPAAEEPIAPLTPEEPIEEPVLENQNGGNATTSENATVPITPITPVGENESIAPIQDNITSNITKDNESKANESEVQKPVEKGSAIKAIKYFFVSAGSKIKSFFYTYRYYFFIGLLILVAIIVIVLLYIRYMRNRSKRSLQRLKEIKEKQDQEKIRVLALAAEKKASEKRIKEEEIASEKRIKEEEIAAEKRRREEERAAEKRRREEEKAEKKRIKEKEAQEKKAMVRRSEEKHRKHFTQFMIVLGVLIVMLIFILFVYGGMHKIFSFFEVEQLDASLINESKDLGLSNETIPLKDNATTYVWLKNHEKRLNLNPLANDPDNDKLKFTFTPIDNINISVENGIATLTPENNWSGIRYSNFIVDDGRGGRAYSPDIMLVVLNRDTWYIEFWTNFISFFSQYIAHLIFLLIIICSAAILLIYRIRAEKMSMEKEKARELRRINRNKRR